MPDDPSPRTVLRNAIEHDLRNVLVIGEDAQGFLYVAANLNTSIADSMLLMERAKQHLLAILATYDREAFEE